jgi:hypothetical protein
MSNRVSALNQSPIPDGPGNVYWMDAKIIEDLKLKERNRETKNHCPVDGIVHLR